VQVLRLLAKGHTANQIAEVLAITPGTAKQHVRDIRRRLDAINAPHAVFLAFQHGIISTQDAA
jgi:DNA-binding CsgD family transcriptional regulator